MSIIINCAKCGKQKEKQTGHYNRAIKNNQKIYCSNRCSQLDRVKPYNLIVDKETVIKLFDYHEDGYLIWKHPTTIRTKVGAIVGHKQLCTFGKRKEYRWVTRLNKRLYFVHQIIFLYHHGYIPKVTDHKDRDTLNNRIENLRAATSSENNKNRTGYGKSKYLGVSLNRHNMWVAMITIDKKKKYLGCFKNEVDAANKYNEFAIKHHSEFANPNVFD
jgi:hypothetical protein